MNVKSTMRPSHIIMAGIVKSIIAFFVQVINFMTKIENSKRLVTMDHVVSVRISSMDVQSVNKNLLLIVSEKYLITNCNKHCSRCLEMFVM